MNAARALASTLMASTAKHFLAAMIGLATAASLAQAAETAAEGGRKPVKIFDGTTLAGWEGDQKVFRIEDGCIVGGNLKSGLSRNEFLCTTKSYSNFVLRIECKLVGAGGVNAGVQFRSKRVPNSSEVCGFQADMTNAKDGGWWGFLYDESRRNRMLASPDKETRKVQPDGWNLLEIRCEGPRIRISLNGVQTTDYTEKDAAIPGAGIIGLQIHAGAPGESWYRNIVIEELP